VCVCNDGWGTDTSVVATGDERYIFNWCNKRVQPPLTLSQQIQTIMLMTVSFHGDNNMIVDNIGDDDDDDGIDDDDNDDDDGDNEAAADDDGAVDGDDDDDKGNEC